MAFIFDGPNKKITLDAQATIEVADLYSRWKQWVATGDNSKYLPAFSVVGGDAISPTANLAVNVFVRNDIGWRIAPPEQDIDIILVGNIYPTSSVLPWRLAPVGNWQTSINTDNSVNAVVVATSSGGGSSSPPPYGPLWP